MKQGIKFLLRVEVGIDISKIEKMEFIFKQGYEEALFLYPSDRVYKINDHEFGLIWEKEDTYKFDSRQIVEMDTRITLNDSEYQPETEIIKIAMKRTLFKEVDESGRNVN